MAKQWPPHLLDTQWSGKGELWLDPESNNAELFSCDLQIEPYNLFYNWQYENETKKGSFKFSDVGGVWVDSWHQPESANCVYIPGVRGLFTVEHSYTVPSSPDWAWRSKLSERPDGDLVLQMTNLTPWGEEGRAVRMIFKTAKKVSK